MYLPVDLDNLQNMNWSIVVMGALIVFSGLWWIFHARFVYIKDKSSVVAVQGAAVVLDGVSKEPSVDVDLNVKAGF